MHHHITRDSPSRLVRNDHSSLKQEASGSPGSTLILLQKIPIEVLRASFSNVSGLGQTLRFRRHKVVMFHLDAPSSQAGARNPQGLDVRIRSRIKSQAKFQTATGRESSEDFMKRACLLIVVPALLVALGFAQTPTASSNPAPTSIKGCLGGADGNYTLAEDNTGHNFKLAPGSVDLKPFLGQSVALIGLKASTTASSGAADNGFAVTEAKMISEHCTTAAVAPAASISTTADTAITPTVAAATTAATVPTPAETETAQAADTAAPAGAAPTLPQPEVTPPATAAASAAAGPTPAELATPPSAATPPPAIVTPPAQIVEAPPAAAERPSARSRRPSGTPTAAAKTVVAAPPAETATPVADTAIPAAAGTTPSTTATEPDQAAPRPAVPAKSGSLLWIPIVVVVLILGAMVPLFNRWRKRRLLEQTGEQNLSFSHRASSEPGTSNKPTGRKAA
jgi:hypothetical protein